MEVEVMVLLVESDLDVPDEREREAGSLRWVSKSGIVERDIRKMIIMVVMVRMVIRNWMNKAARAILWACTEGMERK